LHNILCTLCCSSICAAKNARAWRRLAAAWRQRRSGNRDVKRSEGGIGNQRNNENIRNGVESINRSGVFRAAIMARRMA
jgi:hypothetical protein